MTIGEIDAAARTAVPAGFRSALRGVAAASALHPGERKVADSVTLTPITFMEADEVKHQKLSKGMVSIVRHGSEDGHNADKVWLSRTELLENLCGHLTAEQIEKVQ